jgi:hypothetical protein
MVKHIIKKIGVKSRSFQGLLILISFGILLAGCNLPLESGSEEMEPGLVYTLAAQTIDAKLTEDAGSSLDDGGRVAETTIPQSPTQTEDGSPTPTIQPTETTLATSTFTQTEMPPETEIPNLILEDDFSNNQNWYTDSNDDFGFEYKEGGYLIYNNLLNAAIWSVQAYPYDQIIVEIDAKRVAGPEDGYFGVLCRFSDDGENYYALVIGDNGFYGILKMENGEKEFLETGIDKIDIINRGLDSTNRIQGLCSGDRLLLMTNGKQLLEIFDDSLSNGIVGLVAGNRLSGVGLEVIFDNFALAEP